MPSKAEGLSFFGLGLVNSAMNSRSAQLSFHAYFANSFQSSGSMGNAEEKEWTRLNARKLQKMGNLHGISLCNGTERPPSARWVELSR